MKKPYFDYTPLAHQIIDSKLTQAQFSEKANISQVSLSRALNGKQDLSYDSLLKICTVLDCTINDIMQVVK